MMDVTCEEFQGRPDAWHTPLNEERGRETLQNEGKWQALGTLLPHPTYASIAP